MAKSITKRELLRVSEPSKMFSNSCLVDTNIVFGAAYVSDSLHASEFAESNKVVCCL
jgi:hypothetical protein